MLRHKVVRSSNQSELISVVWFAGFHLLMKTLYPGSVVPLAMFLLNSTLAPYERKSRDMDAHIIIAFIHHYSNLLMPSLSTDSNPSPCLSVTKIPWLSIG